MGVPSFYRWLSQKYPKIVVDVIEANEGDEDADNSKPNPNEREFDYLYLDMNGIIHPCSHPEDKAPPTEDDIMVEIMKYIDRLFNIVRPRKLLFMAIDGVAPRAKMNQQRSRRFRAAQEAQEKAMMEAKLAAEHPHAAAVQKPKDKFDSNCITPGTTFMKKVSEALAYYVADRQSKDRAWANIKVILSDASVPGEGEHKIMEFIRSQRMMEGYDPNLKHVIYGLDADLIMLTLATHEAHFTILREVVFFKNNNGCHTCGQPGHMAWECKGKQKAPAGEHDAEPPKKKPYQFLYISVLREYLVKELHPANLPFNFEPERVIDDFVFLCFFVGNDFLPHLPTLEIREGAIELLMSVYNRVMPRLDGYITHNGDVNLQRAEAIISEIGSLENQILINRRHKEQQDKERRQRQKAQQNQREQFREQQRRSIESMMAPRVTNHSVADSYRSALLSGVIPTYPDLPPTPLTRSSTGADEDDDEPPDEVRLGEEGWKARYYKNKFDIALEDENGRAAHCREMARSYVEGLCWVLKYYYQGCCSWRWYYPYHYAPFSGDMVGISDLKIHFEKGEPFHPFEQLMCVLPLASKQCLPEVCQKLMESADSPLYKYYPTDFKIDMNGKRHAWQGVALLPFIDEKEFLPIVHTIENFFSDEERKRNRWGHDFIISGGHTTFGEVVRALYSNAVHGKQQLDPKLSGGLFGSVSVLHHADAHFDKAYPSPLSNCPPVVPNKSVSCHYYFPEAPPGHVFPAALLPGAQPPPPVVSAEEGERRKMRPDNDAVARLLNRGMQREAGARFHPTAGQMDADRNRGYDDRRHNPLPPPGGYHPGHKRSRSEDDFSRRGAPRTEHYGQPPQHQHQQQYASPRGPPIQPFAFAPAAAGGAPAGFSPPYPHAPPQQHYPPQGGHGYPPQQHGVYYTPQSQHHQQPYQPHQQQQQHWQPGDGHHDGQHRR